MLSMIVLIHVANGEARRRRYNRNRVDEFDAKSEKSKPKNEKQDDREGKSKNLINWTFHAIWMYFISLQCFLCSMWYSLQMIHVSAPVRGGM